MREFLHVDDMAEASLFVMYLDENLYRASTKPMLSHINVGTGEEIVEIMTWGQLGHHRKPMVFANIGGFWNPMLAMLDHMRSEGFIHTGHLVQPMVIDHAEAIVPAILTAATQDGMSTDGSSSVLSRM